MDEVTQIGDEKMLGRVATEWREVCRWDEPETPAFKVAAKPQAYTYRIEEAASTDQLIAKGYTLAKAVPHA